MGKADTALSFAVIGHFGGDYCFNDGQTVKTKNVTSLLENTYRCEVKRVDTYNYKRHPVRLLVSIISCLYQCKYVFVLLSRNGRMTLLPIIALVSKFTGANVYHCLIGGKLADDVEGHPWMRIILNALEINWVETHLLVEKLKLLGVDNAAYLPNFKMVEPVKIENRMYSTCAPYRLCTFSRVMREKGILDAIEAVELVNRKNGQGYCTLDVYGPVEDSFRLEFEEVIGAAPSCSYKGCAESGKAVEILSHYDCLLFPTKWEGEGIPGTIIDAFAAGVPIVAYRWTYSSELLSDGITGFCAAPGDLSGLSNAICSLLSGGNKLRTYGRECVRRSFDYSPQKVVGIIAKVIHH